MGSWKPGIEESMKPLIVGPGCLSDLVGLCMRWRWEGECLRNLGWLNGRFSGAGAMGEVTEEEAIVRE